MQQQLAKEDLHYWYYPTDDGLFARTPWSWTEESYLYYRPVSIPCIDAGWRKLRKYYLLTERSPAYTAAIVLCPNTNGRTSDQRSGNQIGCVLQRRMWQHTGRGNTRAWNNQNATRTDENPAILKQRPNTFFEWKAKKRALTTPSNLDEYDEYINAPVIMWKNPSIHGLGGLTNAAYDIPQLE